MDLVHRSVALAAKGSTQALHVQNIAILTVSIFSILGASWIILSFLLFPEVRTFRHQLILGLAISDLIMAINFMLSTTMNLAGHFIGDPANSGFCNFNGFMTQWFVVQTDYWVLIIAICTFFLIADRKNQASWVQTHRYIVYALPPGVSIVWACVGLGLHGYANIGAWCWFPSDRTRLLVNFLPRWAIIICILGVYASLYVMINRAHQRFVNLEESAGNKGLESKNASTRSDSLGSGAALNGFPGSTDGAWRKSARTSTTVRSGQGIPALKKIAYRMMTYPLVYMCIWIIPTSIRIYQASTGKPAPTSVATVDKACIVIQGLADAIIYGYNEGSMSAWKDFFAGRRRYIIEAS